MTEQGADDPKQQQAQAQGGVDKKEKKKGGDPNRVIPPKKPKLSKAERRALQEQQRAAKAARQQQQGKGGGGGGGGGAKKDESKATKQQQQQHQKTKEGSGEEKKSENETTTGTESGSAKYDGNKTFTLFSHLPQYQDPADIFLTGPSIVPRSGISGTGAGTGTGTSAQAVNVSQLHPAVIELGYKYASGQIRGGNARVRAMFQVFHQVLQDYNHDNSASDDNSKQQQDRNMHHDHDFRSQIDTQILKPSFTYWTNYCRPHSVSMGNAFTFLKTAVASLDRDLPHAEMVSIIQQNMEAYIRERIDYAKRAIAQQQLSLISSRSSTTTVMAYTRSNQQQHDREVILTYGYSEAIETILLTMHKEKKHNIHIIVVDSRPLLEGKRMLDTLCKARISCSYVLMNALSYVMKDVNKVYLGASALMSDGSILGRIGTACVALAAYEHHNIPVLICCESYKISSRIQLESITGNELGNPDHVKNEKSKGKEVDNLRYLNLLYDLTPSEYISGIITELGIIPPTSVAVLLREMMTPQD